MELTYAEDDILGMVQYSVMSIVSASKVFSTDELAELQCQTRYFCDCPECEKENCVAHSDLKWKISVSRKHFRVMADYRVPVFMGLLELIYSYLHEVVHNFYPDAPRDDEDCSRLVQKKTDEIWCKGMANISARQLLKMP